VPEPRVFELEMAIEKLKSHRSPGIGQIYAELIKAGGRTIVLRFINLLILLPEEWEESIIVPIYKKGDKTRDFSN
jgi:hypothetical protein